MTGLFGPAGGPRVFGLPPGADFLGELVAGLEARLDGQPPEAMARVEIWLNTRRAARGLAARLEAGPARLLPRIRVVTELAHELPPPASALGRKLALSLPVRAMLAAERRPGHGLAGFEMAARLADLMDEMAGEGVPVARLGALDVAEHAAHWQASLRFLDILGDYAAGAEFAGEQARLREAAEAVAAGWAAAPPAHPVIVAGSTGSRAPTRIFMAAAARLPQGAVVLPGLDPDLPAHVWPRLAEAEDHPQAALARLVGGLGVDPAAVPGWTAARPPVPARAALVSLAMRPAPVTDEWLAEGPALRPRLAAAMGRVAWIEAESPREEATAVALALREAAESGRRAALVTPDRTLARQVGAALARWGLIPDDSAGRPLGLTPPGLLLRLLAGMMGAALTPVALLALLKHPLVSSAAGARRGHLLMTGKLERGLLAGGPPELDWPVLEGWAAGEEGAAVSWIAWLRRALEPLADPTAGTLAEHAGRLGAAAEALAAGPEGGAHGLWDRAAGGEARAVLEGLGAEEAGGLSPGEFRALLEAELATRNVPEEAAVTHGGIAIWGTLEARVQTAERLVLAGLNEGVWPRMPEPDPWLSRGMRRALGLPMPEGQVGLSAHDFQNAAGAVELILSRAKRDAEAPTVPSRWLLRWESLLGGLGAEGAAALREAQERGAGWLALARRLDRAEPVPRAARPEPRPPAEARPARLSVTQVERLIRDPYEIYARHVLKLKPLDLPGRQPDALSRGIALHGVLDGFMRATEAGLPGDAEAVFLAEVERVLAEEAPWPAVRAIWRARLLRAAPWFLATEAERRVRFRPLAREVRGGVAVAGTPLPFELTARADRIDAGPEGYAIYDYKSGAVPTEREARAFRIQLMLEALIVERGGFAGLAAGRVAHLEYIGFGAGRRSQAVPSDAASLGEGWARLVGYLSHYQDPGHGFTARLRPQQVRDAGAYDHLARHGEWADGDEPVPEDVA